MIEPELIKAGDSRLRLGMLGRPPRVDCRVVAEENYIKLKKTYDLQKLGSDEELLTNFAIFMAENIERRKTPASIVREFYAQ